MGTQHPWPAAAVGSQASCSGASSLPSSTPLSPLSWTVGAPRSQVSDVLSPSPAESSYLQILGAGNLRRAAERSGKWPHTYSPQESYSSTCAQVAVNFSSHQFQNLCISLLLYVLLHPNLLKGGFIILHLIRDSGDSIKSISRACPCRRGGGVGGVRAGGPAGLCPHAAGRPGAHRQARRHQHPLGPSLCAARYPFIPTYYPSVLLIFKVLMWYPDIFR